MAESSRYRGWTARVWAACIVSGVLAGCQTIPDISSWNQSTKDVTSAVTTGFHTAADVNGDIGRRLDSELMTKPEFKDAATRYASVARELRRRATDYEKLFGAITDYSTSLAAIARASENSQKTVDAVAGSLNQLVGAVGGTSLTGAGFELGKSLTNEVIKVKAAHDFGEAVQKADPVIGQISTLLIDDLADLQRTVTESKDETIRVAIQDPHKTELEYRAALVQRRTHLQLAVAGAVAPEPPPAQTTSLLKADDAPELAKIDQYLRDTDTWFIPMNDELNRALMVRAKSEELTVQARRAVEAWRDSHASLGAAVKERRMPESGRLAALAVRVRDLIAEIKKED